MTEDRNGAEPEPVDETDESAKLYVSDPDDYAKTRKMKAINDAKAHVRKRRNNRPPKATQDEWSGINARTAEAVASYGHELLPLLEEAEAAGTLEADDYEVTALKWDVDVRTYLRFDGQLPNEHDDGLEYPPSPVLMAVYRQLERLERKIGIGPSLEEDSDNEWEIQT